MGQSPRDRLFELLEQSVRAGVFPGCVALVWRAGAVLYHEGHGHLASDPEVAVRFEPVTRDTVFDLSSLTKVLATTGLAAIGVSEGWIRLDDPVPAPWSAACPGASLQDVLEHCAGFPPTRDLFAQVSPFDRQRVLQLVAEVTPQYPLRSRSCYSDLGFMVLTQWLEQASGRPFEQLFRDRIAYPLGLEAEPLDHLGYRPLTAGGWLPGELERRIAPTEVYDHGVHGGSAAPYVDYRVGRQRCAHGEVHDDNAFAMGGVAGHAGLFGDAWGVLQVAQAWLEGLLPGLDTVVRDRFWQPSAVPGSVRRLGFDGVEPGGGGSTGGAMSKATVGHLGFTGTSLWIDPEADDPRIVILLSNRVHPTRDNPRITELRPQFHRLAMQL